MAQKIKKETREQQLLLESMRRILPAASTDASIDGNAGVKSSDAISLSDISDASIGGNVGVKSSVAISLSVLLIAAIRHNYILKYQNLQR
jgi:hypothetical protein